MDDFSFLLSNGTPPHSDNILSSFSPKYFVEREMDLVKDGSFAIQSEVGVDIVV